MAPLFWICLTDCLLWSACARFFASSSKPVSRFERAQLNFRLDCVMMVNCVGKQTDRYVTTLAGCLVIRSDLIEEEIISQ